MKVPFFRPSIGQAEINEVVDCLQNGWLTTGPKVAQFESAFAAFLGGGVEALALNSATAGLHLALEALGIGPGDEVIVPDYTFTATAEVVRYLGADPVFVDVDRQSLNMTAEKTERAITSRTRAIMPVHFGGLACNMTELLALASRHKLFVVEDAAHAIPTTHGGQLVGSLSSDATVFSFYANKTMTTGEGGMLVTRNPQLAKRARVMRLHGFDRDAFSRFKTGAWMYDIVAAGYKYNMTDMAAAIGIHQLKRVGEFQGQRQAIAGRYMEGLKGLPLALPVPGKDGDVHSWHLFVVRLSPDAPVSRDQLFMLLSERGITCSVHYRPLHKMTYWRERYGLEPQHFPVSSAAGDAAITLPLFPGMTEAEVEYVIASMREALERA